MTRQRLLVVFLILAWATLTWAADPAPVLHITDIVTLPRMISALCGVIMLLAVAGFGHLVWALRKMVETNGKQWETINAHGERISHLEGKGEE